jgi:ABC-type cobalamin/Fe3+-siderophores transport system ATPase subunit
MDQQKENRLSDAAGRSAKEAITALSIAAACEELIQDGSHSEGQLWFLARALCNEHGVNYEQKVLFARSHAQQIANGHRH